MFSVLHREQSGDGCLFVSILFRCEFRIGICSSWVRVQVAMGSVVSV